MIEGRSQSNSRVAIRVESGTKNTKRLRLSKVYSVWGEEDPIEPARDAERTLLSVEMHHEQLRGLVNAIKSSLRLGTKEQRDD